MKIRSLILPVVALFALVTSAARAEDPRIISTTGEAVVYVKPDEAVVSFGIESFAPKLDKAKEANEQSAAKLLKAIKGMNVEEKHIQTDTVQIDIKYEDASHPVRGIEGYYARRTYSVTLKDVKQLEKFIDTLLTNGANQLHGFEYRTSELRKHRDHARKMAIAAAKEKAQALSSELSCKIGSPRNISEGAFGYYGMQISLGNASFNGAQNGVQAAAAGADGGEDTVPLGQIAIRASVSVVFDLVP